ncbi:hypothetical protein FH972_025189 [Carpinus fangiana]|uniref:Uncharacterized protein n=1 Tax=Carpinus fangiana TaxID=176857 RepID=A0A5N6L0N5_9ROSI|nr:hypothetical protein FH972_025189 [Carpinus fangiana]
MALGKTVERDTQAAHIVMDRVACKWGRGNSAGFVLKCRLVLYARLMETCVPGRAVALAEHSQSPAPAFGSNPPFAKGAGVVRAKALSWDTAN